MFNKSIDNRLSDWVSLRQSLEFSLDPLQEVWNFWKLAPFIPYNRHIDSRNHYGWPTPWDIIVDNKYDDFTRALMIGRTLMLTDRYSNSTIEIKTLVDKTKPCQYNIVCIDNQWVLNYNDIGPVSIDQMSDQLELENIIPLSSLE